MAVRRHRIKLDWCMSGWHQSPTAYFPAISSKQSHTVPTQPAHASVLIGWHILTGSYSLCLSTPATSHTLQHAHSHTPLQLISTSLTRAPEQLISPQFSPCGWVPQIPQWAGHCLCSANCPVEGKGGIKPSSSIYKEANVDEGLSGEGKKEREREHWGGIILKEVRNETKNK